MPLYGTPPATQAEQEAGTSASSMVTPSTQHYHPSSAKFWAHVTVSGGTPSLSTSYNVTSITDTALGVLRVTIATDFSGTSWAPIPAVQRTTSSLAEANTIHVAIRSAGIAAGTLDLDCYDTTATTNIAFDPTSWAVVGFGDQA